MSELFFLADETVLVVVVSSDDKLTAVMIEMKSMKETMKVEEEEHSFLFVNEKVSFH